MAAGWAAMRQEGALARWRTLCESDPALVRGLAGAAARFAVEQEGVRLVLALADGGATIAENGGEADTTFSAPAATWAKFLQPTPPRHHHNLFALRMRVPEFQATGDELVWAQHCHLLRRALDLGRWVLRGGNGPAPASLRPSLGGPAPCPPAQGRYVPVQAAGRPFVLYGETSGAGRPILGLHTAGADGRQFHRLMADPRLAEAGWSVTTFDMPGHGRSPAGSEPGAWALDTDLYAELVLGFLHAWGFAEKPVLLGASMSGEIALEMAIRAPERFAGIVACEAADHIPGRRTPFATHPRVNAAVFTPEWVEGLMAPQSPAECAAEVWWHCGWTAWGTSPSPRTRRSSSTTCFPRSARWGGEAPRLGSGAGQFGVEQQANGRHLGDQLAGEDRQHAQHGVAVLRRERAGRRREAREQRGRALLGHAEQRVAQGRHAPFGEKRRKGVAQRRQEIRPEREVAV